MISSPGNNQIHFWRLDDARHAQSWDSGLGAQKAGGRWNSKGRKVVYASADAATAILEVAVHKGFEVLDGVRHVLTGALVLDAAAVFKVDKSQVPNPNWLLPGRPGMGQQKFADALLAKHPFVLMPSTVSPHSWNLLINPEKAKGLYRVVVQETFGLDTRLHPPLELSSIA
jgi:RES domain-containing protein